MCICKKYGSVYGIDTELYSDRQPEPELDRQLLIDVGFKRIKDGGWDCDEVYYHDDAEVLVFYGQGKECSYLNAKSTVAELIKHIIECMKNNFDDRLGEALSDDDW